MKKGFTAQDHAFAICAYKENRFLEDLVVSLEVQTAPSHILVATSTPNAFIEDICERHSLPMVVNDGESSIALDWNFAYNHAPAQLVTIAHQDDVYEPMYVERVLDALNADGRDAGVVHTGYYELREEGRVDHNRLLDVKQRMNKMFQKSMAGESSAAKRRALSFGNFICCPSVTFVKDVVGPSVFDTEYANSCDWRTWVNLASRNVRFLHEPDLLMGHRIYSGSTTTANIESNVRSTEDLEILESLWPRPIARAIFALYSNSEKSNG